MALLHNSTKSTGHQGRIDLVSLAILFVAVVAIALILVGVAVRGTSSIFVVFPMLLGFWAILGLRR